MGNTSNVGEEKFLYQLMSILYEMQLPIVFKGAMVLKVIQYQYNDKQGLVRETHDVDGDWVGTVPSMQYLTNQLQIAVNRIDKNIKVIPFRAYGDNKSAGFNFVRADTKQIITQMDLGMRQNTDKQIYVYVKGIQFCGQTIDKVVADKVLACSERTIYRRIKDLIDLNILQCCWKGTNKSILVLFKKYDKQLGQFNELLNGKENLRHAYERYKNPASILPFDDVYNRVLGFLEPFIKGYSKMCFWDGNKWVG